MSMAVCWLSSQSNCWDWIQSEPNLSSKFEIQVRSLEIFWDFPLKIAKNQFTIKFSKKIRIGCHFEARMRHQKALNLVETRSNVLLELSQFSIRLIKALFQNFSSSDHSISGIVRITPVSDQEQQRLKRLKSNNDWPIPKSLWDLKRRIVIIFFQCQPGILGEKLQVLQMVRLQHSADVEHLDRRDHCGQRKNHCAILKSARRVKNALSVHENDDNLKTFWILTDCQVDHPHTNTPLLHLDLSKGTVPARWEFHLWPGRRHHASKTLRCCLRLPSSHPHCCRSSFLRSAISSNEERSSAWRICRSGKHPRHWQRRPELRGNVTIQNRRQRTSERTRLSAIDGWCRTRRSASLSMVKVGWLWASMEEESGGSLEEAGVIIGVAIWLEIN